VSPDAHTPAERADAVLRAAEAAAAAAQAAAAAAHAASIPPLPEPPAAAPAAEPPAAEPPEAEAAEPPEPPPAAKPPQAEAEADARALLAHEAGAPARLLAAAAELEAHVAQAQTQLGALEDALERLARPVDQAD
jgi:hypothetical protein